MGGGDGEGWEVEEVMERLGWGGGEGHDLSLYMYITLARCAVQQFKLMSKTFSAQIESSRLTVTALTIHTNMPRG